MRLGILLDRLGAGGSESHTRALVARALAAGEDVTLAMLEGTEVEGCEVLEVPAPRRRPERDRQFAERGVAMLRDRGCDAVLGFRHCPGVDVYLPHGGLVGDAVGAQDAARGRVSRVRLLARAWAGKQAFFWWAERRLLGAPEGPRVICVSHALQARMRTVYPACAGRTVVIPNGVDTEHFDPERVAPAPLREERGMKNAYVGLLLAMHPRLKGAEAVIRAMTHPEVEDRERPFHLVVAGGTLERNLRVLARRRKVHRRVHEVGYVEDPRPLYAAADVLVHPTFHDPCSLACLEALAMGLPVITTPPNGVRELMGTRGGIVVEEPGNPVAVAVALRVLADPALRTQTAEDAREIARAHPLETALDRVLDVCRAAAG